MSARGAHRLQHCLAGPAVDLETGGLLIRAECCAGLHAGLAVEFILVETDPRQMALHRLYVLGAQLRRCRPRRCERQRTSHAVAEMSDEKYIEIGKIILLDDEIVLRGQERRTVDALGLQQR